MAQNLKKIPKANNAAGIPTGHSIKKSLLTSMFLVLISTFTLIGVWAYLDSRHEVNELFDAQLASQSALLQDIIQSTSVNPYYTISGSDLFALPATHQHDYQAKLMYQLMDHSGTVLFNSLQNHQSLLPEGVVISGEGYQNLEIDNTTWRLLITKITDQYSLIVGQQLNIRNELTNGIATNLITHTLLALPFLLALFTLIFNRNINQVNRLSQALSGLQPHQRKLLHAQPVPLEIAPLVAEIEKLMQRAEHALEDEREFASSAAHELKTPLAAIRIQLENLLHQLNQTPNTGDYQATVKDIIQTFERTEYLTTQLLTLQKMQPELLFSQQEPIDLNTLTHQSIEALAQPLIDKNIDLNYSQSNLSYISNPLAMQLIVSNLLGNAVRYTPNEGSIALHWRKQPNLLSLIIEDSGPGIAPNKRDEVFRRFYRQNQHRQMTQGCGLGLYIVKKAVDGLNAHISLDESAEYGGLKVTIHFPAE